MRLTGFPSAELSGRRLEVTDVGSSTALGNELRLPKERVERLLVADGDAGWWLWAADCSWRILPEPEVARLTAVSCGEAVEQLRSMVESKPEGAPAGS